MLAWETNIFITHSQDVGVKGNARQLTAFAKHPDYNTTGGLNNTLQSEVKNSVVPLDQIKDTSWRQHVSIPKIHLWMSWDFKPANKVCSHICWHHIKKKRNPISHRAQMRFELVSGFHVQ